MWIAKAAFTRQTNIGQLVLANSNWCVCEGHNNMLENCYRQIELVSILANSLPTCCCVIHSHQFEFANTSWPTLVWRVKAALCNQTDCRIQIFSTCAEPKHKIVNNYSPQCRWRVVDIYRKPVDSQHQIVPFFLRNERKLLREIQNNAGRWITDTIPSLSTLVWYILHNNKQKLYPLVGDPVTGAALVLTFQPPVAPTSHNYTEMRDKLRLRLNKRQVRFEGP